MADVAMPRLSDSMEEGTIVKWLKSDGDTVSRGEPIVEIETDKANMTYEADAEGVLSIVAQEGDTLPIGEPIARIGDAEAGGSDGDAEPAAQDGDADEGEAEKDEAQAQPAAADGDDSGDASDDGAEKDEGQAEPAEAQDDAADAAGGEDHGEDATGAPAAPADEGGERVKASPVARRLAEEAGVELGGLEGSGPGGRIVKADVEAAAESAPSNGDGEQAAGDDAQQEAGSGGEDAAEPVPAPVTGAGEGGTAKGETSTQELTRGQQVIARRMAESKATAPDFHLTVEVDMEAAAELRKELRSADPSGPAPSFNDLIVKASALALRDFPRANGAYRDAKFESYSRVNVGIAVAAEAGLVVPTIFDADRKSLGEIARDSRAVAERVRAGKITPPELSGGTFTVSNLGMYGIRRFVAVLNPPQAAILSVGAVEPRPVVKDGEVVARTTMELTLVCDHRILYGAEAAEFLAKIRERLEQPLMLAL